MLQSLYGVAELAATDIFILHMYSTESNVNLLSLLGSSHFYVVSYYSQRNSLREYVGDEESEMKYSMRNKG